MVVIYFTVGKDQDICTISVCTVSLNKESVYCLFQTCVLIIYDRNRSYLKSLYLHITDLHEIGIGKDRIVDAENFTVLRLLFEKVSGRSDIYRCRSNHFLTNGIDWWVCYLCEQLLEVVEQWLTVS